MSAKKMSVYLDPELAASVREAAADERISVSTWLAGAAQARVRQHYLRVALDAVSDEFGEMPDEEIDRHIAAARRTSRLVNGRRGTAI